MSASLGSLRRYRASMRQFIRFGLIGGAGVLVNMATVAVAHNLGFHLFGIEDGDPFIPIPNSDRAIRYYIVYAGIAFLVANLFNFWWNRHWTFKDHHGEPAPFMKEFMPFLLVGAAAQIVGFLILVLLRNPYSPFYLSADFFTNTGPAYTRRLYWAQLIQIICVMPINFVVNKLWTFRHVRQRHAAQVASETESV